MFGCSWEKKKKSAWLVGRLGWGGRSGELTSGWKRAHPQSAAAAGLAEQGKQILLPGRKGNLSSGIHEAVSLEFYGWVPSGQRWGLRCKIQA